MIIRLSALLGSGALAVVSMSGGGASAAAPLDRAASAPHSLLVASADNGKIAFVQRRQIVTINADGTEKTVLTSAGHNFAPAWSPDGTKIAYVHRDQGGARDLWVMDADGANPTPVTTTGRVSTGGASWSPDGLQLAFGGPCLETEQSPPNLCQWKQRTVLDVVTVSPTIGAPVTLVGTEGSDQPSYSFVQDRVSWSSDGDHLAFAGVGYGFWPGDSFILVYELSTASVAVQAVVGAGGTYGVLANPAFSPDGSSLGYDANTYDQGGNSYAGVKVCGYPDGACDQFAQVENDTLLAFAPAQDRVAIARAVSPTRILLADADGTNRSRLTRGTAPSWQPVPTP